MLREGTSLIGQTLYASDGKLGAVEDVRFDDRTWDVRHVVVRTGVLHHEHLLIEPRHLEKSEAVAGLGVWMSKHDARQAPHADSELTVADQRRLISRTTWQLRLPEWLSRKDDDAIIREAERLLAADRHLRSLRAVRGYRVAARDGSAGRVRDLIVDDEGWSVSHVQIDADLFWGKKPVLLLPRWIERIGYEDRILDVALTRHAIGGAPRFHRLALVSRLYQMYLYDYYAAASGEMSLRLPPRHRLDMQLLASSMNE